jgi:hypothetical protein
MSQPRYFPVKFPNKKCCKSAHCFAADAAALEKVLRAFVPGKRRREFRAALRDVEAMLLQTRSGLPNLGLYSASVLMVYDGDKDAGPMDVEIIDFAHAYIDVAAEGGDPGDSAFDDNSVRGLDSLMLLTGGNQARHDHTMK